MYKKSNFFVSLGMLVYSIVWTTWTRKYWVGALQRLAVVVLQLHPVVHVIESIQVGIETTGCKLDNVLLNLMIFNIDGIPDNSLSCSVCSGICMSWCISTIGAIFSYNFSLLAPSLIISLNI